MEVTATDTADISDLQKSQGTAPALPASISPLPSLQPPTQSVGGQPSALPFTSSGAPIAGQPLTAPSSSGHMARRTPLPLPGTSPGMGPAQPTMAARRSPLPFPSSQACPPSASPSPQLSAMAPKPIVAQRTPVPLPPLTPQADPSSAPPAPISAPATVAAAPVAVTAAAPSFASGAQEESGSKDAGSPWPALCSPRVAKRSALPVLFSEPQTLSLPPVQPPVAQVAPPGEPGALTGGIEQQQQQQQQRQQQQEEEEVEETAVGMEIDTNGFALAAAAAGSALGYGAYPPVPPHGAWESPADIASPPPPQDVPQQPAYYHQRPHANGGYQQPGQGGEWELVEPKDGWGRDVSAPGAQVHPEHTSSIVPQQQQQQQQLHPRHRSNGNSLHPWGSHASNGYGEFGEPAAKRLHAVPPPPPGPGHSSQEVEDEEEEEEEEEEDYEDYEEEDEGSLGGGYLGLLLQTTQGNEGEGVDPGGLSSGSVRALEQDLEQEQRQEEREDNDDGPDNDLDEKSSEVAVLETFRRKGLPAGYRWGPVAGQIIGPNGPVSHRSLSRIGKAYHCTKCGAPKKGHKCPLDAPPYGFAALLAEPDLYVPSPPAPSYSSWGKRDRSGASIPRQKRASPPSPSLPPPLPPVEAPVTAPAPALAPAPAPALAVARGHAEALHAAAAAAEPTPPSAQAAAAGATSGASEGAAMVLDQVPQNAKALLNTGLLEGQPVKYIDKSGKVWLTGIVKDAGILCACKTCKGKKVVNASEFERHAGSTARHPSDHIHLATNGKCLKEVILIGLEADTPQQATAALIAAIGGGAALAPRGASDACTKCGGFGTLLCCDGADCPDMYHARCVGLADVPDGEWLCPKCTDKGAPVKQRVEPPAERRRPPVPPPPPRVHVSATRPYKRDPGLLHKALFQPGGLPDGNKLAYYIKGQKLLEGVKDSTGILCSCCNSVVSCSQFEQHAGYGSRRNPYNSIFLEDGRSLHEAALQLATKTAPGGEVEEGGSVQADASADTCGECGDGGNLVLCDGCPAAYHAECVGLAAIPAGDWYCPACEKSRGGTPPREGPGRASRGHLKGGFSAGAAAAAAAPGGRTANDGVLARCKRLLNDLEPAGGGCVLCRSGTHDFAKSGFGVRTIMLCDQCEREFHVGCLRDHGLEDLRQLPEGEWFCSSRCQHIHSVLLQLLARRNLEVPGCPGPKPAPGAGAGPRGAVGRSGGGGEGASWTWQLLRGRRGDPLNGKALAAVVHMFTESFDPIIDSSTGRNLIPLMVHSRSTRDHDFSGMYTLVLRYLDKPVSAACLRIFGGQLAEMPLVATSTSARRQGHCKGLLAAVEWLLAVLHVDTLCLPAAKEAADTWLHSFSFSRMPEDQFRRVRGELQMLVFPGALALHKAVPPLLPAGLQLAQELGLADDDDDARSPRSRLVLRLKLPRSHRRGPAVSQPGGGAQVTAAAALDPAPALAPAVGTAAISVAEGSSAQGDLLARRASKRRREAVAVGQEEEEEKGEDSEQEERGVEGAGVALGGAVAGAGRGCEKEAERSKKGTCLPRLVIRPPRGAAAGDDACLGVPGQEGVSEAIEVPGVKRPKGRRRIVLAGGDGGKKDGGTRARGRASESGSSGTEGEEEGGREHGRGSPERRMPGKLRVCISLRGRTSRGEGLDAQDALNATVQVDKSRPEGQSKGRSAAEEELGERSDDGSLVRKRRKSKNGPSEQALSAGGDAGASMGAGAGALSSPEVEGRAPRGLMREQGLQTKTDAASSWLAAAEGAAAAQPAEEEAVRTAVEEGDARGHRKEEGKGESDASEEAGEGADAGRSKRRRLEEAGGSSGEKKASRVHWKVARMLKRKAMRERAAEQRRHRVPDGVEGSQVPGSPGGTAGARPVKGKRGERRKPRGNGRATRTVWTGPASLDILAFIKREAAGEAIRPSPPLPPPLPISAVATAAAAAVAAANAEVLGGKEQAHKKKGTQARRKSKGGPGPHKGKTLVHYFSRVQLGQPAALDAEGGRHPGQGLGSADAPLCAPERLGTPPPESGAGETEAAAGGSGQGESARATRQGRRNQRAGGEGEAAPAPAAAAAAAAMPEAIGKRGEGWGEGEAAADAHGAAAEAVRDPLPVSAAVSGAGAEAGTAAEDGGGASAGALPPSGQEESPQEGITVTVGGSIADRGVHIAVERTVTKEDEPSSRGEEEGRDLQQQQQQQPPKKRGRPCRKAAVQSSPANSLQKGARTNEGASEPCASGASPRRMSARRGTPPAPLLEAVMGPSHSPAGTGGAAATSGGPTALEESSEKEPPQAPGKEDSSQPGGLEEGGTDPEGAGGTSRAEAPAAAQGPVGVLSGGDSEDLGGAGAGRPGEVHANGNSAQEGDATVAKASTPGSVGSRRGRKGGGAARGDSGGTPAGRRMTRQGGGDGGTPLVSGLPDIKRICKSRKGGAVGEGGGSPSAQAPSRAARSGAGAGAPSSKVSPTEGFVPGSLDPRDSEAVEELGNEAVPGGKQLSIVVPVSRALALVPPTSPEVSLTSLGSVRTSGNGGKGWAKKRPGSSHGEALSTARGECSESLPTPPPARPSECPPRASPQGDGQHGATAAPVRSLEGNLRRLGELGVGTDKQDERSGEGSAGGGAPSGSKACTSDAGAGAAAGAGAGCTATPMPMPMPSALREEHEAAEAAAAPAGEGEEEGGGEAAAAGAAAPTAAAATYLINAPGGEQASEAEELCRENVEGAPGPAEDADNNGARGKRGVHPGAASEQPTLDSGSAAAAQGLHELQQVVVGDGVPATLHEDLLESLPCAAPVPVGRDMALEAGQQLGHEGVAHGTSPGGRGGGGEAGDPGRAGARDDSTAVDLGAGAAAGLSAEDPAAATRARGKLVEDSADPPRGEGDGDGLDKQHASLVVSSGEAQQQTAGSSPQRKVPKMDHSLQQLKKAVKYNREMASLQKASSPIALLSSRRSGR